MMQAINREAVSEILAQHGFTLNPAGIAPHVEIEEDQDRTWFDINAEAIRIGDTGKVPNHPIRVTYQKSLDELKRVVYDLQSVLELSPDTPTNALPRQLDEKFSPWPIKPTDKVE
jgi:hypothetical protein